MAAHAEAKVVDLCSHPPKKASQRSPFVKHATLVLIACFLIGSRAAHTLLCQPIKHAKVDISIMIVMVEAASFPISILIWVAMSLWSQGEVFVPNRRYRLSMYALMGFLDAINSYMSAAAVLKLHVAVYTVLKASSIVFSVLFAKMFTKKQFTAWHYLAVFIMFGASFLSCFEAGKSEAHPTSFQDVIWGAVPALLSSAALGLLGVTTYKFVRHEKQKSDLLCIAENNAFQALFMFIFMLPMLAMREVRQWPELCSSFSQTYSASILIWILVGLFISRPIMLFSSIAATSFASAALTRALGAPRRLIVVVLSYYMFNEVVSGWKKWLSITLMCCSLIIYAYGGFVLQKMKKRTDKARITTANDVEKGLPCSSSTVRSDLLSGECLTPKKI